ncbi:MAG: hypothetical protein QG567_2250 [Campylobacterota bacterium]|nr:hypothetical protein [Campylobacterota bacterium]
MSSSLEQTCFDAELLDDFSKRLDKLVGSKRQIR